MSSITFDTLKFANKLKDAGVPPAQAEAEAEAVALSEVFDVNFKELATKDDLKHDLSDLRADLKLEMADIKSEMKLMRWMLTIVVGGVIMLVLKAFFPVS